LIVETDVDDEYIMSLIDVAEDAYSLSINMLLSDLTVGGELPPSAKHSILLLIGNLYANREPVAFASANKVPYTFEYLTALNKNYSDIGI